MTKESETANVRRLSYIATERRRIARICAIRISDSRHAYAGPLLVESKKEDHRVSSGAAPLSIANAT